jgi:hypothetical protein
MDVIEVTGTAARAALASAALVVPPAAGDAAPGTLGWLRASVGRFATGDDHARRRAAAIAVLPPTTGLRERARELATVVPAALVAPAVLAEAMGVRAADVPAAVADVAPHYLTGELSAAADRAVAALVAAFGGVPDEATAARIGVLVQACGATAALVAAAAGRPGSDAETALAAALAETPPVPATRRLAVRACRPGGVDVPTGATVVVELAGMPFGAGPRACPGREQALAIAAGVLDALRAQEVSR